MIAQTGRFYDDIVIGEVRESAPRTVTQQELLEFATRYDPQYFHADPVAAEQSIFGELIASGIHGAALWRALDHEISGDIRWICGIAWEEVRWPNTSRGIVEYRYTLLNQRNEVAFTCRSINLIEMRPNAS
jgi:acyl dehydratase